MIDPDGDLWAQAQLRPGQRVDVPIAHTVSRHGTAVAVRWDHHLPQYILVTIEHDRANGAKHPQRPWEPLDTYEHPHWAVRPL